MSLAIISAIKAKFETGDFPTEQDFIDWIDSMGVVGSIVTKDALTGTHNNYDLGTGRIFRLTTNGGNRTITGLSGGIEGRRATIVNFHATNSIQILDEDSGSAITNRVIVNGGGTYIELAPKGIAEFLYDSVTARWRISSYNNLATIGAS